MREIDSQKNCHLLSWEMLWEEAFDWVTGVEHVPF